MKNQKGITLVALIITIIVMLILVAVTVTVVIQSGILNTTKTAAEDYKNAVNAESNGRYNTSINNTDVDLSNYTQTQQTINSWVNP